MRGLVPRSQDVCLGLDLRGCSGANREVVKRMGAGTLALPGGLCSWHPAVTSHAWTARSAAPACPLATLQHRDRNQGPGRGQRAGGFFRELGVGSESWGGSFA